MDSMNTESRAEIIVHSRGIGTAVSYGLLAFAIYILIMAFINNPMGSYGVTLAMSLIVVVPVVLLADYVSGLIVVNDNGLTRIGLLGRKTVLLWDRVKKVRLVRNSAGLRELVVAGRGKKIVLTNTFFLIAKPNFWEAAFVVIKRADEAGWPVKTGFLGREAWFYHGSEYLPGEKFKDFKENIEGPKAT